MLFEPLHVKIGLMPHETSGAPDQHAHLQSLVRNFLTFYETIVPCVTIVDRVAPSQPALYLV
ncbi:hypothetical protein DPMN_054509 [Dreissena polymorpha]|uniref:Uncharacterized protein n=1 Tax=Dreissena polymorpha TaxID=45954 RepID=A0A9D4CPL4_DREPO|nr:hypothetical protein DPMN_054509 [Dreissena polymorpha]